MNDGRVLQMNDGRVLSMNVGRVLSGKVQENFILVALSRRVQLYAGNDVVLPCRA